MSVKNTLQWYSCNDILLIWRNCWPHEHTCTHTPTHTLFTVKVNGSAIGPDSTVLYYHGTLTTVRLDLLGKQMSTAVGLNTSKRPITGQKTAAASVEDVGLWSQPNLWCKNRCMSLAAYGVHSKTWKTVPVLHHILWPRGLSPFFRQKCARFSF